MPSFHKNFPGAYTRFGSIKKSLVEGEPTPPPERGGGTAPTPTPPTPPTPPPGLDCPASPSPMPDIAISGIGDPLYLAIDTVNNVLWCSDANTANIGWFNLLDSTQGTLSVSSGTTYGIFYDLANQQIIVLTADASTDIVFIDANTKTEISRITHTHGGLHTFDFDPATSRAFVCSTRGSTPMLVIDCTARTVLSSTAFPGGLATDAIAFCANTGKVFVTKTGGIIQNVTPLGYYFDPTLLTFTPSALTETNPGVNFHTECLYIYATGHLIESCEGNAAPHIINPVNDTLVGSLPISRPFDRAQNSCTNRLLMTMEGYGYFEFDLLNPATPYWLVDNPALDNNQDTNIPSADGVISSRRKNLNFVSFYSTNNIRSFVSYPLPAPVPAIQNYNTAVLPHLVDAGGGVASGQPAWAGVFDHYVAGFSFTPKNYFFNGHSLLGFKAGGDDNADYPAPGWQDNDFFTEIYWDLSISPQTWALQICYLNGNNLWFGHNPNQNINDPSGTYVLENGSSVSPSHITVVLT